MKHITYSKTTFCLILIGIALFILNHFMPLHRDDYEYALIWNTSIHIQSLSDVYTSLAKHYLEHGGRMVAFSILDSFLLLPKVCFNIANSIVYTLVILLILWHSLEKITWHISPYRIGFAFTLTWLCFPHYGEVATWMCGATVYLWTTLFMLAFLLPYHIHFKTLATSTPSLKNKRLMPLCVIGMFFLGILAGWGIENASLTTLTLASLATWYAKKKNQLVAWQISGFFGCLTGFILLVIAPGNMVRSMQQYGGILRRLGNQFAGNGEMFLYSIPLLFCFILAYRIVKENDLSSSKQKHISTQNNNTKSIFLTLVLSGLALLLSISYITTGFIGKGIGLFIQKYILFPLHLTKAETTIHLFNLTSGIEEMGLYVLLLYLLYTYIKNHLSLSVIKLTSSERNHYLKSIWEKNNTVQFITLCIGMAFFNNLVMLGAPTFPARATFFSIILLIIATLALGNIPIIQNRVNPHIKYMAKLMALFLLPFYGCTVYFAQQITIHDQQQLSIIQEESKKGTAIVSLSSIPIGQRMQRHIFYVDFYNPVSKGGLCRYYQIKDIKIEK